MKKNFEKKEIAKKAENFSKWYTDVVLKSGMAEYAPVKGCQIFNPYGFAVWENIKKALDDEIKKMGVKNAYFPLFIPESFLKKEKEHVEGFSPELAVVTIGGGKKLEERLIVRPTSETVMYHTYAKWINSWRDLPVLINQWCNVVRWEKRPRLFLRTSEFLWQEGHTVHETHKESLDFVKKALKAYIKIYRDFLAIDGFWGVKSELEKFPGAEETYTFEALMPDGKALQGATSHDLGRNFSKPFGIKFKDREGKEEFPWQTSWGFTTRSIGAMIMVHGDDAGLVIPPKVAPIQVVIIPIFKKGEDKKIFQENLKKIKKSLKNFRIEIDQREEYSPGWKFNEWELKGVPLRIEIGQREIKEKKLTLTRRDNGKKEFSSFSSLNSNVKKILNSIQSDLLSKSKKELKEGTREIFEYREFKKEMKNKKGFLKVFWCGNSKCESEIKKETKATIRCFSEKSKIEGKCIYCGKKTKEKWIFAQSY